MSEQMIAWCEVRFGSGYRFGSSWWHPDGFCPYVRYPGPNGIWTASGSELVPFTGLRFPG